MAHLLTLRRSSSSLSLTLVPYLTAPPPPPPHCQSLSEIVILDSWFHFSMNTFHSHQFENELEETVN